VFFFSSRRRHTRFSRDWSSDVCSSDLVRVDARERQVDVDEPDLSGGDVLLLEQRHGTQGEGAAIGALEVGHFVERDGRVAAAFRSEERRVGKECRSVWAPYKSRK